MTQTEAILDYLNRYGSITPVEALREIGCFRLAARIHDLEKQGHHIPRRTVTVIGKRTGKKVQITEYLRPTRPPWINDLPGGML